MNINHLIKKIINYFSPPKLKVGDFVCMSNRFYYQVVEIENKTYTYHCICYKISYLNNKLRLAGWVMNSPVKYRKCNKKEIHRIKLLMSGNKI